MSAGIYLFQTVGDGSAFQTFLEIVVISCNVVYLAMAVWWWLTLKLIDLGNQLTHNQDKNHSCTAHAVLCMQKCLPDWREQTLREEIRESENHEVKALGQANILELLKAKKIAHKWLIKSREGRISRKLMQWRKTLEGPEEEVRTAGS